MPFPIVSNAVNYPTHWNNNFYWGTLNQLSLWHKTWTSAPVLFVLMTASAPQNEWLLDMIADTCSTTYTGNSWPICYFIHYKICNAVIKISSSQYIKDLKKMRTDYYNLGHSQAKKCNKLNFHYLVVLCICGVSLRRKALSKEILGRMQAKFTFSMVT